MTALDFMHFLAGFSLGSIVGAGFGALLAGGFK